jgi:hypothetical protein
MGFLRKTIIIGTGGLAPIKSRSYAERSAKAMEKMARLQEQQMAGIPAAPGRPAQRTIPKLETSPWLVIFQYGDGKEMLGSDFTCVAQRFATEEKARAWAAKQTKVRTPSGKKEVAGYSVVRSSPDGDWQLTYTTDDGASLAAGRYASKEDALRVVKASWKVHSAVVMGDGSVRDGKITTVKSGRAEPVQTKPEVEAASRPGLRDPWLNEVGLALAPLGFTEYVRNTGKLMNGIPLEGDIGMDGPGSTKVFVNLFADDELARQGEVGFRANPKIRSAIEAGFTVVTTVGRVVYWANGQGNHLEPSYLGEVIEVVDKIGKPPPLDEPSHDVRSDDPMDQLRKLGELRDAGVLTCDEFEAKKAKLLERI